MQLNQVRHLANHILVKLALGVVLLSFLTFGVGDMLRMQDHHTLISVGKHTRITDRSFAEALHAQLAMWQERTGQAFSQQQIESMGLRQHVLRAMVQQAYYAEAARSLYHITPSDALLKHLITGMPAFANEQGQFEVARFQGLLEQVHLSEAGYVERLKEEVTGKLLQHSSMALTAVPPAMTEALYFAARHERVADLVYVLPAEPALALAVPDMAALRAFYEEHTPRFRVAEQRAAALVWAPSVGEDDTQREAWMASIEDALASGLSLEALAAEQGWEYALLPTITADGAQTKPAQHSPEARALEPRSKHQKDEPHDSPRHQALLRDKAFQQALFALEPHDPPTPSAWLNAPSPHTGQYVMVLASVTPETVQPFEEVLSEVQREWQRTTQHQRLNQAAELLRTRLEKEPELFYAEFAGHTTHKANSQLTSRPSPRPAGHHTRMTHEGMVVVVTFYPSVLLAPMMPLPAQEATGAQAKGHWPEALRAALYEAEIGAVSSTIPVQEGSDAAKHTAERPLIAFGMVQHVLPPPPCNAAQTETLQTQLQQFMAEALQHTYLTDLETRFPVRYHEDNLERILRQAPHAQGSDAAL